MKKRYMLFILVVVFGLLFWVIIKNYANQIPEPGQVSTKDNSLIPEPNPAQIADLIIVSSPLPDSTVGASPILIKGRARGNWFFEATAPVTVVNWDGLIIGQGYIKVDDGSDWMTTDFVPFTGTINYDASQLAPYKYGSIILKKDNPSDNPKFDNSLEFKILFP